MPRTVNPDAQKKSMESLIQAGIKTIYKSGVDRVSVQAVSEEAKTSRPTFYSYFGDIEGLLAEIWLAKADLWLAQLANPSKPISKLNNEERVLNQAMAEIFAASHRIPQVQEVVEPKMAEWWKTLSAQAEMHQLKVFWLIGHRLGTTITKVVDNKVIQSEFIEQVLSAIPDDLLNKLPKLSLPELATPEVEDVTLDTKLLRAAIEIIASSGVEAASMARVARRAQVSTGAVYPRFSKVDTLIESSFEVAISKVVEQNFGQLHSDNFGIEDFGNFVIAGLLPKRTIWRNFRIEIHLGAVGRPSLQKRLANALAETNKQVAQRLAKFNIPQLAAGPIPYLVHTIGIGLAVLLNAGLPVDKLDHRQITTTLVKLITESA
ncbi:MAG: Bacterial regulatory protein tetR family [Actinomycetota bacterium]|jgi:AcrR family transcriptional regulator